MKEKTSTIKNPLTVIAIFAGTAEISGTAILPFLESTNQQIYIWFLMLFPILLIIFFFITLNWNHKVLYAPSDFLNEDNFVNILKKPTIKEVLSKSKSNLEEDDNKNSEISNDDPKTSISDIQKETTKEEREQQNTLIRNITRQRISERQMAELLVLSKLEKELKTPIQREMKIEVDNSRFIFDGVIQKGSDLTGIEVKYMRTINSFNTSMWIHLTNRFERLYNSLNKTQKKSFSIIFAIVTDSNSQEIKSFAQSKFKSLNFPLEIRVYDFDSLKDNE